MDIIRQSACLVINPIMVYSYGFLFYCKRVGQASESMTTLYGWVGASCMSKAGPTMAQLKVFFSSESLCVESLFLCFITVC